MQVKRIRDTKDESVQSEYECTGKWVAFHDTHEWK